MDVTERRGSKPRVLERSFSYSEAIGNDSRRSSIQIPSINNTEVYTNEELKKHHRISQTYVEGREITFPTNNPTTVVDTKETIPSGEGLATDSSQYDSEDEENQGLVLSIDVEPSSSSPRGYSDLSTQYANSPGFVSPVPTFESSGPTDFISSGPTDIYDRIDRADSSVDENDIHTTATSYATPYSKRKKRGTVHRRRRSGRPIRSRRVVLKDGSENVPIRSNIPAKRLKYMRDVVNTVINSKWRFIIIMMVVCHFVFWLVFATIWYIVSQSYADDIGDGRQHCVNGTSTFAGLMMMSVETQMTIGYGVRFPNEECPEAIIVMVIEIVVGTAMTGGLSSLLFVKLVRPNKHISSVGFSKKAAVRIHAFESFFLEWDTELSNPDICLRDGELVLQFRVWDLLNLHIITSDITAYILKPIRTLEGEFVQNYIHQLKLTQANAFLLWPITVVHVINEESPLYEFSAQDLMDYRFEIVVCLTGSSKSMGTVAQSRTSYLSKEIIWGYRFKNVLHYSRRKESYIIDVENLNTVEQVVTPLCSASRFKEFQEDIKSSQDILSTRTMSWTNLSIIWLGHCRLNHLIVRK
ncbi:inward rectifier potassium channel domain-containing protein [Phthorimaea operculella]|nr:inward rectifier potassium channel domain-containing protein [Phthorimaea operculella]